MASSSTTRSSNITSNSEERSVFVAYNGKWEWEGKELLFMESKGSIMVVSKYVTLSQITDILCTKFDVDRDSRGLKLEADVVKELDKWRSILILIEESHMAPREDDTAKNRLIKAIRKNDWVKAREIVNTKEVTWTSKLDDEGNTALHFAVGLYKDNEVVRDILMRINCELLVTTVDNNGANAAHIAALFGNTEALKIMLDSNPKCLFILDNFGLLAIHYPLTVSMIKTFLYLFKQMKSYKVEFDIFLRGQNGLTLLCQAIDKGLIGMYAF
ncbi:ankyrin repeat family protein [Tanacetum coccineum]